MDKANFKDKLKTYWKTTKLFLGILFALFILIELGVLIGSCMQYVSDKKKLAEYPYEIMRQEALLSYQEHKSKLVKIVDNYIDSVAPTSSLNGYAIVVNCEKYDLDIKFVLAQGQIESKFGTCGMASKTNSVFNVGAYDNKTYEEINGKYKYKHPDYSIEPYMQLLYREYITATKTELDLMAKYVTKDGQRYASNQDYEKQLFALYQKIDSTTNITELQGEMRRYKIISGQ